MKFVPKFKDGGKVEDKKSLNHLPTKKKTTFKKVEDKQEDTKVEPKKVELPKKAKSGIKIDPKNKGKFTETKKRTGKTTEELTHSKNPLTKKRAIFAQNAKKWNHK